MNREKIGRPPKKEKHTQKTIYLTDEQFTQLRSTAFHKECDQSEIVRQALDDYFKKDGYCKDE
jgi:hypothetical protein